MKKQQAKNVSNRGKIYAYLFFIQSNTLVDMKRTACTGLTSSHQTTLSNAPILRVLVTK